MHLDSGEILLKTFYHHYTPFIYRILKVLSGTIPFYFMVYLFKGTLTFMQMFWLHVVIVAVFSLVTIYVTLVFWLDRLIITNRRLIFIDWKYLTVKSEYETELKDVQDITSIERGVFSAIPIFDYGTIEIKTSSNQTTIIFEEAPNPNGIKKLIQQLLIHISNNA
jgi:hypothetical protein